MSKYNITCAGKNCITSSVNLLFKSNNYIISEYELLTSNTLLNLSCNVENDTFFSDIFSMIKKSLSYRNISLNKINRSCVNSFLQNNIPILLNININALNYFKVPGKERISNDNFHFIIISGQSGDLYHIHDSYIPSIPASTFNGWIKLDEKALYDSTAYVLNFDYYKKLDFKLIENNMYLSLENTVKIQNNNIIFSNFIHHLNYIRNIHDISIKKNYLFNALGEVNFGGTHLTREFLYKFLSKNKLISEINVSNLSNLNNMYHSLRMLFLKSYVTCKCTDIQNSIEAIKKIQYTENELFNKLLNDI